MSAVRGGYNLGIPNVISNSASGAPRHALQACSAMQALVLVLVLIGTLATPAAALDWSAPEQQLARKIVAVTGSGPITLQVENRSSIGRRDSEVIENGLRSTLETVGLHIGDTEHAAVTVTITLSENLTSYVWVAQIAKPGVDTAVAIVSIPRPAGATTALDSVPLSLRKTLLWSQVNPILDVAVIEENAAATRVAVLDPEEISGYRLQNGKWTEEQSSGIVHTKPWPRDLRGRLIAGRDHVEAYLPGVVCRSSGGSLNLSCRDSDDPWPLLGAGLSGTGAAFPSTGSANASSASLLPEEAFFSSARNFFNGTITPAISNVTPPKFYSAAAIPHGKSMLWLFAGLDGQLHIFDGGLERVGKLNWGSDVTSVKTSCGAGWQVLASSGGESASDSLRAYEIPDRDPVAVSAAVDFPGPISALWTEARGDTATAVARNLETGSYEAYRVAVACSQ